jgi:hypothetical protein
MLGSVSAALPRHGRPAACATRDAETERPRGLAPGEPCIPAADARGPLRSNKTIYLLWYGPVIAINSLLLDWVSANTLVSAEAALLNLLFTAVLRNHLAVALSRAAVWPFNGWVANDLVNRPCSGFRPRGVPPGPNAGTGRASPRSSSA